MSTQLAQRDTTTALSIQDDQQSFTEHQLAALQQLGLGSNSRGDIEQFFHVAKATGLDPFRREIYMITRNSKQGKKATIQTGIDGYYKIADRATRASGGTWGIPETKWCGPDGVWRDIWLESRPPAGVMVTVERDGSRFVATATFAEYNAGTPLWQKMPARMLAKCAEALAIRKAFPDVTSGLYATEEMGQADTPAPRQQSQRPTLHEAVQAVNHQANTSGITEAQWNQITAALTEAGYEGAAQPQAVSDLLGRRVTSPAQLTAEDADRILTELSTVPEDTTTEAEVVPEDGEAA